MASPSGSSGSGHNDEMLLYSLFAIMVLVGGYVFCKIVGGTSYILFWPLVAPTYMWGNIFPLMLGVSCMVLGAVYWFKFGGRAFEGPRKYYLFSLGSVFLIGGIFGGFAAPVELCQPKQLSPSWDFHSLCQVERRTLLGAPTFWILSNVFIYNLLVAAIPLTSALYNVLNANKRETTDPMKRLGENLDFQRLVEIQSEKYPWLKYYNKLRLAEKSLTEGQYRRMDTTKRFVFSNLLVTGFTTKQGDGNVGDNTNNEIDKTETMKIISTEAKKPELDKTLYDEVFAYQLGDIFNGFENMQPIELYICCIAIPRACCASEKVDDSVVKSEEKKLYAFLDKMWDTVTNSIDSDGNEIKPVFTQEFKQVCLDRLEPWLDSPITQKIINNHAYNRTVVFASIMEARRLGVLISVDFGWIKTFDRTLWALFQNVGRDGQFAECVAVTNHYFAERLSKRKIYSPQSHEAWESLTKQIDSYAYDEEFEKDWKSFNDNNDAEGLVKRGLI